MEDGDINLHRVLNKYALELASTLLIIPPKRLRTLAKYMKKQNEKENFGGTDIEDDLNRMADASEEVLTRIKKEVNE